MTPDYGSHWERWMETARQTPSDQWRGALHVEGSGTRLLTLNLQKMNRKQRKKFRDQKLRKKSQKKKKSQKITLFHKLEKHIQIICFSTQKFCLIFSF